MISKGINIGDKCDFSGILKQTLKAGILAHTKSLNILKIYSVSATNKS